MPKFALSHSSIQLYLECPQKWKFRYIDKIPEKPKHFFSFGNSLHAALEYFYNVKTLPPPTLEDVLKFYHKNWLVEGYTSPEQEEKYKKEGAEIIQNYYQKHVTNFQIPHSTEHKFDISINDIRVVGYIDRIDSSEGNTLSVIDYKSGKSIPSARLEEDPQLTLYQIACEAEFGKKIKNLTFYHLPSQTALVTSPRSQAQIDQICEQIISVAGDIDKELFPPLPGEPKCTWCDYKSRCPAFKPFSVKKATI